MPTHYDTLGIRVDADAASIRRAYRRLSRQWHPDANAGASWAEERFKGLVAAYEILSNPEKRRQYDLLLKLKPVFGETSSPNPAPVYTDYARRRRWTPTSPASTPTRQTVFSFQVYAATILVVLLLFTVRLWYHDQQRKASPPSSSSLQAGELIRLRQAFPELISQKDLIRLLENPDRLPPGYVDSLENLLRYGDTAGVRRWVKGR